MSIQILSNLNLEALLLLVAVAEGATVDFSFIDKDADLNSI